MHLFLFSSTFLLLALNSVGIANGAAGDLIVKSGDTQPRIHLPPHFFYAKGPNKKEKQWREQTLSKTVTVGVWYHTDDTSVVAEPGTTMEKFTSDVLDKFKLKGSGHYLFFDYRNNEVTDVSNFGPPPVLKMVKYHPILIRVTEKFDKGKTVSDILAAVRPKLLEVNKETSLYLTHNGERLPKKMVVNEGMNLVVERVHDDLRNLKNEEGEVLLPESEVPDKANLVAEMKKVDVIVTYNGRTERFLLDEDSWWGFALKNLVRDEFQLNDQPFVLKNKEEILSSSSKVPYNAELEVELVRKAKKEKTKKITVTLLKKEKVLKLEENVPVQELKKIVRSVFELKVGTPLHLKDEDGNILSRHRRKLPHKLVVELLEVMVTYVLNFKACDGSTAEGFYDNVGRCPALKGRNFDLVFPDGKIIPKQKHFEMTREMSLTAVFSKKKWKKNWRRATSLHR